MTITVSRDPDGVYVLTVDGEHVVFRDPVEFPLNVRLVIKNSAITFPDAEELKRLREFAKAYFPHNPIADRDKTDDEKRDEFTTNVLAILGDYIDGMPDAKMAMSEIKRMAEEYGLMGDE